uniref:Uncharacterized protein n=1 Tax=Davidia involucrata TaxID=16924 RepID=A0A5B7CBD8_DAVIN
METPPLIKASSDLILDFPFKTPPQSFLLANGINNNTSHPPPFRLSDIEMVALQSLTYTSLKDLLPAASPPSIMSPTYYNRRDSWREIPIKDPLVKHAAWAYLQPMTTPPEADGRSCFSKLKDKCCGCFGGFFNDVVLTAIKSLFAEEGGSDNENEEDDDDDDKVD